MFKALKFLSASLNFLCADQGFKSVHCALNRDIPSILIRKMRADQFGETGIKDFDLHDTLNE